MVYEGYIIINSVNNKNLMLTEKTYRIDSISVTITPNHYQHYNLQQQLVNAKLVVYLCLIRMFLINNTIREIRLVWRIRKMLRLKT